MWLQLSAQTRTKPGAESGRQRERTSICNQNNYVVHSVNQRRAVTAVRKMEFQLPPRLGRDGVVDVIRHFAPHVFASHRHGFLPFLKIDRLSTELSLMCGATRSRISTLARTSRVLTTASLTSSICAVLATSNPSISRSTKTSRYISGRLWTARTRISRTSLRSRLSDRI